ncbi:MAG: acetyl-CoA carboxylase, carboxyltransferase subunit beta [Chlamydiia bacterium]
MTLIDLIRQKKGEAKTFEPSKEGFNGWTLCSKCQQFLEKEALEEQFKVCPLCDHHMRLSARERIALLVDPDSFEEKYADMSSLDPLKFTDTKPYLDRVREAEKSTGLKDAVLTGFATLKGRPFAIGAMDFQFIGGSLGSVVGEKLTRLIEEAIIDRLPLVIVSQSGGARMQESIFSLMQMAKVSQAIKRFHEANLFYISVLTDPTMGGVTASFASLGDLIMAEPKALIGFAGARVIEQTIKQKLPQGAQTAEFQLEHGLIDMIVPRKEMKEKIDTLFTHFLGAYEID